MAEKFIATCQHGYIVAGMVVPSAFTDDDRLSLGEWMLRGDTVTRTDAPVSLQACPTCCPVPMASTEGTNG